jgi:uncharacterized protein YdhG (YjbR/CyaY superfamily)
LRNRSDFEKRRALSGTTVPGMAKSKTFTDEEKAAMKEAARERKSGSGESDVLEKIAEMPDSDRAIAEGFHALVKANAPDLAPRTWYGMPAYAKDDKVVCHFQPAQKFKARYATIGFSDKADLDDGAIWPVAYALAEWNADVEKQVGKLVKKAVS